MVSSDVDHRTDQYATRTWYGRRRKPAARKATPKGGYDRYRGYDALEEEEFTPSGVDLSVTAFAMGIAAIVLAWWPYLKFLGLVLALGSIVMATRELSRHDPESRILMRGAAAHAERFARTGRTFALIAILVVVGNGLWGMKTAADDRARADGDTALVLQQLDVQFGQFVTGVNGVGQPIRMLPVTIHNGSGDQKTFRVQLEALDANGQRVSSDELLELSMRAGETRARNAFQFVDEPTTEALKTATFRVAAASARNR